MNSMELSELALRAAEEVEKGWCQGRPFKMDIQGSEGISVCMLGAVSAAVIGRKNMADIEARANSWEVVNALAFSATGYFHNVLHYDHYLATWNDEPGRTKEEVAEAWRQISKEIANNETANER